MSSAFGGGVQARTPAHPLVPSLTEARESGGPPSQEPPDEGSQRMVEMLLPVELIIAEARRWDIADAIALQVLPTGRVNILWRGSRGNRFVDHLFGLQAAGRFDSR
jgi:hypothetical protein